MFVIGWQTGEVVIIFHCQAHKKNISALDKTGDMIWHLSHVPCRSGCQFACQDHCLPLSGFWHGGASPLTLGRSRSLTSSIRLPGEHKENGHVTDFFGICETGSDWFPSNLLLIFSFELHGDAYKKWTTKWCLPSAIKGVESFAAQMYDGLILCSCLLVCLRCWKILLKADIHQRTQHYVNIWKNIIVKLCTCKTQKFETHNLVAIVTSCINDAVSTIILT